MPELATATRPDAAVSVSQTPRLLQRACACGGTPGPSGECTECRAKGLQRQARPGAGPALAPPIVHDVLRSPGKPLDTATRAFMEPRFGHDFSRVRIHTDAAAAESAQAVDAHAYTVGPNIVFAASRHDPSSNSGRQLLAHELTHVLQQGAAGTAATLRISEPDDASEMEATRVADTALAHEMGADISPVTCHLQRQEAPYSWNPQPQAQPATPAPVTTYGVTPTPTCTPGSTRIVDLQPVAFKTGATDPSPTGTTWLTRLAESQTVWNKLGVSFNALSTVEVIEAANKTAGSDHAGRDAIRATRSGTGVEVFMVDNDIADAGGAATVLGGSSDAKIVLADRGTSDTLLAHELGHVLGLGHPPGGADPNTIMTPSASHSSRNSTRNTIGNYNRITWPAPSGSTCISPDP